MALGSVRAGVAGVYVLQILQADGNGDLDAIVIAIAHLVADNVDLALTRTLLIGSVPGAWSAVTSPRACRRTRCGWC
jgi:hypothetical protein